MTGSEAAPSASLLERRRQIFTSFRPGLRVVESGRVIAVGDGIVWVDGLPEASIDEIIELEDGSQAMVFHLTRELLGAVLLVDAGGLAANARVRRTGRLLAVAVGDHLIGRVVDPLGRPLDGQPLPDVPADRPTDVPSPPIVDRDFVKRPLYTGNKILDAMLPLGKGQRQLLIGDNGLGKTSLALDIVANQRGKQVQCVYVLIGQKRTTVLSVLDTLQSAGAMDYTTLVVAEATALPGLRYLAPYTGCTFAEHWMHRGRDTLIVYDDLTNHAQSYREMSLLLRRPPGREAYPADIFYLHSRLLERATCLAPEKGGGSMTALPLIETEAGDITAFIPTNLISITDGQIVFRGDLMASGFLPAIDITRSVSRIGGKAQDPATRREAAQVKLDYLQFLELEAFTRFGARLEAGMEQRLKRGRVLRELLKQERLRPVSIEQEVAWLVAYNDGLLDDVAPEAVPALLDRLLAGLAGPEVSLKLPREELRRRVDAALAAARQPR